MKIAPVADVKARFSSNLKDCEEGPVVVTKNGCPKAVLVAARDEKRDRTPDSRTYPIYGSIKSCRAANQKRTRNQAP